ncbi:MAG: autotransporter-associated beta strand repeat-containing protein [Phycisphaerae bacterium]
MHRLFSAACLAGAMGAGHAAAAPLSWDPGITGGAAGGSTGSEATEWKASGADNVWWDGATNVAWTNGEDATFTGTAGNVRLGGNNATISVGTLNFGVSGYTIDLRDFTDNTANNLAVTGISGESATITNTSGTTRSLTINNDTAQAWSGTITSQRIVVVKQGIGTLGFSGTLPGGFGANTLEVQNGTLQFTGTVNAQSSGVVSIGANGTLDLQGNYLGVSNANDGFRRLATAAGSTLTSSAAGTADVRFGFGGQTHDVDGTVSGDLRFRFNRGGGEVLNLGGDNSFTGGILFNNLFGGSGTVNANHDNALGTGPINFGNSNGTARVNLRTAAPSIGSLIGSGGGTRQIVLGETGVDSTVTINQTVDGTFTGVISDFAGQIGSLTKTGDGVLTLSGINTYTGDTTVNAGGLTPASAGELRFDVEDGGVSNSILGVGAVTLDGLFRLDIDSLTDTDTVGTWNLVNVATLDESFGGTFGLAFLDDTTFADAGGGLYTSGDWQFSTATGDLTLIPEPASLGLLGLGTLCILGRRRVL